MNFSSNKIIDERRLKFTIPFEAANVKEVNFDGEEDITFEYNIEDYTQHLPFNLSELTCFCHVKVKDKNISLSATVFTDGEDTPKIEPYIEDDGYTKSIAFNIDLWLEDKNEILVFLLKQAMKK